MTLLVPDHEELSKEHEKSNKNKGTISYAGSDLTSEADKYSEWGSRVHYGSNSESIRMERNFFYGNLGQLEASGKRLSVTVSHFPIFFLLFPQELSFFLLMASLLTHACRIDSLGPGLPSISTGKAFESDELPP